MNILEFANRFPDEASAKHYLKELREKDGITCKKCNAPTKHYWLKAVEKWQCAECNSRTNLKAGTVLYKSRIPVRTWLLCIHLMTTAKTPFSALEMQRQLGMTHHKTVWWMMHRVRHMMRKREDKYQLGGTIELDNAFFEVVCLPEKDELGNIIPSEPLKRGLGSQRQEKVLVMVESMPNPKQEKPHKKKRIMGYVKMIAMDGVPQVGINYEVGKYVKPNAHLLTDGASSYNSLNKKVTKHTRQCLQNEFGV